MNRFSFLLLLGVSAFAQLPPEPLSIVPGEPNFVHDSWFVDNHWSLKTKNEGITVVHHSLKKHETSPFEIFRADKPSYVWVVEDEAEDGSRIYRMYYQANLPVPKVEGKGSYRTEVAYAESKDGIEWTKPNLNLFPKKTGNDGINNIVIAHEDLPFAGASAPALIENLPTDDQRGYKFVMLYRVKGKGSGDQAGLHVVGTKDGVNFDMANDVHIAHLHSDCPNTISYDPVAERYQLFCRAKQMYRAFGDEMIDTGASRRVATMRSPKLWSDWLEIGEPQTLMTPDTRDGDHRYFYGMPTVHRHGLFWGFLEVFRMNDFIHTEVTTSRDGAHWYRHPERPKLIEYGDEGGWDDTMTFTSPAWVPVGNHWYVYYSGWDGPHGTSDRDGTVGLATCLRERIFSRRGSRAGGVVCTRTLVWPGGNLWLNLEPVAGVVPENAEVSVRISDGRRRVIDGFDHAESRVMPAADSTRRIVRWGEDGSMDDLKGKTIRIEVMLKQMDWFSFGAEK